jgi:hypothetical protein
MAVARRQLDMPGEARRALSAVARDAGGDRLVPERDRYRKAKSERTTELGQAAHEAEEARAKDATRLTRTPRGTLPDDPESIWREMIALLLSFKRFSTDEIAHAFGVADSEIEALTADPDLVGLVRDLRAVMPMPGEINELLMSDAERNIRWLRKVRDGLIDDDPKRLRIRERAAETLLDRQVPRKVAVQVADERPKAIDITPKQHARMRQLLAVPTGDELDALIEAEARGDGDESGENTPVEHGETGSDPEGPSDGE